jgi:hypothetical protein
MDDNGLFDINFYRIFWNDTTTELLDSCTKNNITNLKKSFLFTSHFLE